jgi:hypothetical protein
MKKQPKEKWRLHRDEVDFTMSSGGSGRRRVRDSRAESLTSAQMELTHAPTGVKVQSCIPYGHYSRKEMRVLKDALAVRLFAELEAKVARTLRIPKR